MAGVPREDWLELDREWLVHARESVKDENGHPFTQDDFAHALRASGKLPPHRMKISDRRVREYEAHGRLPVEVRDAFEAVTGLRIPEGTRVTKARVRKDPLVAMKAVVEGHEERLWTTEQRLIAAEQRIELLATELASLRPGQAAAPGQ